MILNHLIDSITGENAQNLTAQEKIDRINLINTLIGSISEAAGGDTATAIAAAKIEMENNQFIGCSKPENREVCEQIHGVENMERHDGLVGGAETVKETGRNIVIVSEVITEVIIDEVTDPLNYVPIGGIVKIGGRAFKIVDNVKD